MKIRQAKSEDYPQVAMLYQQVHDLHARNRPEIFRPGTYSLMTAKHFEKILSSENDILLVAENEKIIGATHIVYKDISGREWSMLKARAEIESIVVDEKHRGQKTGTALIKAGEKWATDKGADLIILMVHDFNTPAKKAYEAAGYEIQSLKMEKFLNKNQTETLT